MRREYVAFLAALTLAACQGQEPGSDTGVETNGAEDAGSALLFAGQGLDGWQKEGAAKWTADGGDLSVEPAAEPSYLIDTREHRDFTVSLGIDCPAACAPGLFLRRTATDDGVRGILVPLSGADLGSAYAVSYDPQGRETARDAVLSGALELPTGTDLTISLNGGDIAISANGKTITGHVPADLTSGGIVITATEPGAFTLRQATLTEAK